MERKTRTTLIAVTLVATLTVGAAGYAVAHGNASGSIPGKWASGLAGGRGPGGGSFEDEDGTVTGRFVTFTIDPATGEIRAFGLADANSTHPLLDAVRVAFSTEGDVTTASAGRRGGYLVKDGEGNVASIRDSPAASLRVASLNGTTVTIVLPAGATVTAREEVASWSPEGATIDYGTEKARLVLSKNANLAVDGSTLTIELGPKSGATFSLAVDLEDERVGGPHGPGFGHGAGRR